MRPNRATMSRQSQTGGERGAITIQVAFALIALIAFTSFVVDYGVMWVSRRQAQNAADAGALAGALGLILDSGEPAAQLAALQFAANNSIWGQGNSTVPGGNVVVNFSGPSQSLPPCGTEHGCVQVGVFRNEPDWAGIVRGTPLPTYFGQVVGMTEQGVRATATARAGAGNQIKCMLPWAVIDRWADNYDDNKDSTYWPNDPLLGTAGWSANDAYQPTAATGCGAASCDVYIPPYNGNTATTGWKVTDDYGRQLILKDGQTNNYSSGWANIVDLPGSGGGSDYRDDIAGCNPQPVGIATLEKVCPAANTPGMEAEGCINVETGIKAGPTSQGVAEAIISSDANAYWDQSRTGPNGLSGAVVNGSGEVDMSSKRIRPLAVVDIGNYTDQACTGSPCVVKIANIIGFFVEGMCGDVKAAGKLAPGMDCTNPGKDVVGRIVTIPGKYVSGVGTTPKNSAFIWIVQLVR
jgi:hypothetical protein